MAKECGNCDCTDKSQCVKENSTMLEPIIVVADEKPGKGFDSYYSNMEMKYSYEGYNKGNGQDNYEEPQECSAMITDALSLAFNTNKNAMDRLTVKFRQLAQDTQNNFDKNNKLSYEKAQDIFRKTINNPNYKLKRSDIPSIQNALSLDEMKRLEKDISQLSKGLGKVVVINDVYDFFQASVDSYNQKDWRPIFDQSVSFGAGIIIGFAFSLLVPMSIPGILLIGAINALASYTLSRDNIQKLREEIERNFNINNNIEINCNGK